MSLAACEWCCGRINSVAVSASWSCPSEAAHPRTEHEATTQLDNHRVLVGRCTAHRHHLRNQTKPVLPPEHHERVSATLGAQAGKLSTHVARPAILNEVRIQIVGCLVRR